MQLNKFMTNVVSADLSSASKTGGVIVISSTSNMNFQNHYLPYKLLTESGHTSWLLN